MDRSMASVFQPTTKNREIVLRWAISFFVTMQREGLYIAVENGKYVYYINIFIAKSLKVDI